MVEAVTGTITTLQSLYPAEEALKAARRVEDAISDRRDELCRLQGFVSDNSDLINRVRTLPEELSHDIMVPFGGAAFFPGSLIHTNEFLVLLGENYYAERTGKQTMQILQRRQRTVKGQVESLKATIADLELEAKFFSSTAADSAEGFVEIREDHTDVPQREKVGSDTSINHDEDEDEDKEYANMMARLDELAKEELDDRSTFASDENDSDEVSSDHEDTEYDEGSSDNEDTEHEGVSSDHEDTEPIYVSDHKHEELKAEDSIQKVKDREILCSIIDKNVGSTPQQHLALKSSMVDRKVPTAAGAFPRTEISELKKEPQTLISSAEPMSSRPEERSANAGKQNLDSGSTVRKAFTGSIVEHDDGLPPISSSTSNTSGQSSDSGPSKPVSRFKMHRGDHQ